MQQPDSSSQEGRAIPPQMTLTLTMLLASLGTSIANIALPAIAQDLSAPFSAVQGVVVAYVAALTVTVVVAGPVGDRYGLTRSLQAGLGLFLLAAGFCAIAPGLHWLTAGRVLQGIGAAFLMTLSMALMREIADPARLGRAMGMIATASALGTALGPAVGGVLIPVFGWRSIFALQVGLAGIVFVLSLAALPNMHRGKRPSSPSLRSLLGTDLVFSLLVNVVVAAVMMATLVIGPFYLGLNLGLDAPRVGLTMAVGPIISIGTGVPAGRLVDRLGSGRVSAIGLFLLLAGAGLLAMLPSGLGVAGYLASIIFLTPGYQLFQAANNTAVLAHAPVDRRGILSGALTLSRNLGLLAGASLLGWLFAATVGSGDISHASADAIGAGMHATFLVAALLLALALGGGFVVRQVSAQAAKLQP